MHLAEQQRSIGLFRAPLTGRQCGGDERRRVDFAQAGSVHVDADGLAVLKERQSQYMLGDSLTWAPDTTGAQQVDTGVRRLMWSVADGALARTESDRTFALHVCL